MQNKTFWGEIVLSALLWQISEKKRKDEVQPQDEEKPSVCLLWRTASLLCKLLLDHMPQILCKR